MLVIAGIIDITAATKNDEYSVFGYQNHPSYDSKTYANDIAVVQVR